MNEERQLVAEMVSNEATDTDDIPTQVPVPLDMIPEDEE